MLLSSKLAATEWIGRLHNVRGICHSVYDVVISGGGMVGAAAAAALATNQQFEDKKILWLESADKCRYVPPAGYSNRVSALSPASRRLLQDVGAWSLIEESGRVNAVKRMHVWDSCSDSNITFTQLREEDGEEGGENLAYLVENDVALDALRRVVSQRVELAYNTTVQQYGRAEGVSDLLDVHISTGDVISGRLVIGADGFKSLARRSADINVVSWGYEQVGVVATLQLDTEDGGNNTAWQRFLPSGPIAVLPLSKDTSSLVWSTSADAAKALLSMSCESFVDSVNEALHSNNGKDAIVSHFTQPYQRILESITSSAAIANQPCLPPTVLDMDRDSRATFPYGMMHADKYVAPRLALVGDACHRIHPLAGQGVNLGFGDVECLARLISEAMTFGADIGHIDHLSAYETERQRHVVSMTAGVDSLYRLYSSESTPLVLLRSLGLLTVNFLPLLKNLFKQQAQA